MLDCYQLKNKRTSNGIRLVFYTSYIACQPEPTLFVGGAKVFIKVI
jgi:hypothetical protein